MSEPRMIPYYAPPEWADKRTYWCSVCGKWWAESWNRYRCAAIHYPGTCCHEGETAVTVERKRDAGVS